METAPGERRVAATPETVAKLRQAGFEVQIERGAGSRAGFTDEAYVQAGAAVVDRNVVWQASELITKIQPPSKDEAAGARSGATVISLLQLERHPELKDALLAQKLSTLALEKIPRVTRAQKMDVLSSQANLAGYRAVVEAAAHFEGFFGAQITAAGSMPPVKVLIIGAGVAGLAAIAAARSLGAEVRAFDTRPATREQVESLGATFLAVSIAEAGDGGGGYAKVMSPEFIAAEMALFREQAKQVSVIITTALVPGTRAPILLPTDVVSALRPGSVVVDMAAEQGGNCELTKPGEVVEWNGIKILGFTDLASRMAGTASKLFATNIVNLIAEMGGGEKFRIDLENDVVRPALVTHGGELLPPPPRKEPSPQAAPAPKQPEQARAPVVIEVKEQHHLSAPVKPGKPRRLWIGAVFAVGLSLALVGLGRVLPTDFLQHFTVFVLACFVGWQVVWNVTPALHTPLMSVTNAISGIIVVGGILQIGSALDAASILGALAVLVATINIAGGFSVTQRMLKMFRRTPVGEA